MRARRFLRVVHYLFFIAYRPAVYGGFAPTGKKHPLPLGEGRGEGCSLTILPVPAPRWRAREGVKLSPASPPSLISLLSPFCAARLTLLRNSTNSTRTSKLDLPGPKLGTTRMLPLKAPSQRCRNPRARSRSIKCDHANQTSVRGKQVRTRRRQKVNLACIQAIVDGPHRVTIG